MIVIIFCTKTTIGTIFYCGLCTKKDTTTIYGCIFFHYSLTATHGATAGADVTAGSDVGGVTTSV